MKYKLFIDDDRFPVSDDWVIVRSSQQAITYIAEHGCPEAILFDHDLGGEDKATIIVKWMINHDLDHTGWINNLQRFFVHSQNPIGAEDIKQLLFGYLRFINKECEYV